MSELQALLLWPAATRSVVAIVAGTVILLGSLVVARSWLSSWRRVRRAQAAADDTEWQVTDGEVAGTIDPALPILARRTTDLTRYELRQHGVEVGRLDPPQPLIGAAADASASDGAWQFVIRKDGWTWHAVAADQASGAQAATYRRRKLRGANLLIAPDDYELRGSLIKGSWTLRNTRGSVSVAVLRVKGDPPAVELELMPECHGIAELSLLLLFAVWGVLIETALSFSDAPAGGGGI